MATLTGFLRDNEGAIIDKAPTAKLSYTIDWTDWLPTSATISTSTWTLETVTGSTLTNHADSISGTKTLITLSGGTAGKVHKVYNTITLNSGLIEKRYFRLKITERSL